MLPGQPTTQNPMQETAEATQMKLLKAIPLLAFILLAGSHRLHAQITGCDDSPENPTVILGLIVGAAGYSYIRLRGHRRARRISRPD